MDLDTWMTKNDVVDDRLAVALGYSRPYINRVRNGLVNISLEAALKIWDYTAQEIDIRLLLPRLKRPGAQAMPQSKPLPPIAKPMTSATTKPVRAAAPVRAKPSLKSGNGGRAAATPAKPAKAAKAPKAAKASLKRPAVPDAASLPDSVRKPPVRKASRSRATV